MKKKLIVTGGAGFIGSHLCEYLIDKGFKVICLDNLENGNKKNLINLEKNRNFTFYKTDINTVNFNNKAFKNVECVFHLAALADIVPSIENPLKYFNTNFNGTINILEIIRRNKIKKIVYAASSSCYGIPSFINNKVKKVSETFPTNPLYPYAESKYLAENAIKHWANVYDFSYVSLRLFNVFGPRSRSNKHYGAVIGTFISQKLNNKPFTIVGDGKQTRDFVYVADVVKAFYLSYKNKVKNEIINIGLSKPVSVKKLTSLIDKKNKVVYLPERPGEPRHIQSLNFKAKKILKWKPMYTFEEGIKIVLQNKDYWKKSPIWTKNKIKKATKNWFKYLSKFKRI
jgi:UDP-glucose 4-epimerase